MEVAHILLEDPVCGRYYHTLPTRISTFFGLHTPQLYAKTLFRGLSENVNEKVCSAWTQDKLENLRNAVTFGIFCGFTLTFIQNLLSILTDKHWIYSTNSIRLIFFELISCDCHLIPANTWHSLGLFSEARDLTLTSQLELRHSLINVFGMDFVRVWTVGLWQWTCVILLKYSVYSVCFCAAKLGKLEDQ